MLENGKLATLNMKDILPNRFQPRIHFDEQKLNELSDSIRKYGLIQPIVVRQIGTKYEIIAGERRYKASSLANKETIPAIIVTLSDRDSEEIALLENVQREDLTPIEEAVSYKRILDAGYISQEELAKKIGKSQIAILTKMRLLNLDDIVQDALLHGKISERHARSLLKIKNNEKQVEMLNRIINERLTVKMTDKEINKMLETDKQELETLSTSDKPVRRAIPVASHRIIKVNPPKELVDKLNNKKEERVDTMDIDKILEEAQDIAPNEEAKPAADMDSLMAQNPNTMTSPLITNEEPIVPPTEPTVEPGKFVTPVVEASQQTESVPTSGVSFDSVFNQNAANNVAPVNGVQDNSLNQGNNLGVVDNMAQSPASPVGVAAPNMDLPPVMNNNMVNETVSASNAEVSPVISEPVMETTPVTEPALAPTPLENVQSNSVPSPVANDNLNQMNMENTVNSLASEVTPEVAANNTPSTVWPGDNVTTVNNNLESVMPNVSDNNLNNVAPVNPVMPEAPAFNMPSGNEIPTVKTEPISIPTEPIVNPMMPEAPVSNPLVETPMNSQPTTNMENMASNIGGAPLNNEVTPLVPTEPVLNTEPILTPDEIQTPILPGIPGAPAATPTEPAVNMNIPDDSILEETPNMQTPEQINNKLDNSANFRQVINIIRNSVSEIEKLGFYIDTDEIDLGDKYQVTFKIEKQ